MEHVFLKKLSFFFNKWIQEQFFESLHLRIV